MSNDVIIITSDTNGFGDDEFDENKVKWINSKVNTLPQEGIIPSNFLPTLISSLKLRTINNHFNITERNCQIITKGLLTYYVIKTLHCKTLPQRLLTNHFSDHNFESTLLSIIAVSYDHFSVSKLVILIIKTKSVKTSG